MLRRVCGALLVLGGVARADCPTNTQDLPAAGFLASTVRSVMPEAADEQLPQLETRIGVAGSMRTDTEDAAAGAGTASGQLIARSRHGSLTGCVSADVIAARDSSARVTASGSVPLMFTALSMGVAIDRDVELPLSARPELAPGRVSRIAAQTSLAFIDMSLTEGINRLRVMVMPFRVEQAVVTQDIEGAERTRHTTAFDTAMFRFVARDPSSTGSLDVFAIGGDWIDPSTAMADTLGYVRISPARIGYHADWSFDLDGGWLSLAGPVDCEATKCTRGFYNASLAHAWSALSVETRAERTAFMTVTDEMAVEDRVSVTTAVETTRRRLALSALAAATQPWSGSGDATRVVGAHSTFTQHLSHGFLAVIDGELATERGARLFVSLGWERETKR